MNPASKLMLSDEEQQLVNNSGWILTKRIIIDKVNNLLGYLAENQKEVIEKEKDWLPTAVVQSTPKIAKGENYLQLPYVLLDNPRCFEGDNIFTLRTMFWWGNFFSITLHVSGTYKNMFQQKIMENLVSAKQDIFICIHENQWHHHFEADNYINAKLLSVNELTAIISTKQFVKLAVKFPLHEWNNVTALLDECFNEMIEMLKG